MINFFKKEYKERLKPLKEDEFLEQFFVFGEEGDYVDINSLIDTVYQKGWEAYRAAVLEVSYLDK